METLMAALPHMVKQAAATGMKNDCWIFTSEHSWPCTQQPSSLVVGSHLLELDGCCRTLLKIRGGKNCTSSSFYSDLFGGRKNKATPITTADWLWELQGHSMLRLFHTRSQHSGAPPSLKTSQSKDGHATLEWGNPADWLLGLECCHSRATVIIKPFSHRACF